VDHSRRYALFSVVIGVALILIGLGMILA
jgi:hypothetical protein